MEETQVSQSYREALFEISPTTEKKRKKETRGQWWEWSVKEKEKKGGGGGGGWWRVCAHLHPLSMFRFSWRWKRNQQVRLILLQVELVTMYSGWNIFWFSSKAARSSELKFLVQKLSHENSSQFFVGWNHVSLLMYMISSFSFTLPVKAKLPYRRPLGIKLFIFWSFEV